MDERADGAHLWKEQPTAAPNSPLLRQVARLGVRHTEKDPRLVQGSRLRGKAMLWKTEAEPVDDPVAGPISTDAAGGVTALRNWSQKSIDRLARNGGWKVGRREVHLRPPG